MQRRRFIGWTVVIALLAVAGWVASAVYDFRRRAKAEYGTANVVRLIEEFVATNNGEWPTSWDDLQDISQAGGFGPDRLDYLSQRTHVDFSVSSETLMENPERIYAVIMPTTGDYRIYPHARRDSERLLDAIREAKGRR